MLVETLQVTPPAALRPDVEDRGALVACELGGKLPPYVRAELLDSGGVLLRLPRRVYRETGAPDRVIRCLLGLGSSLDTAGTYSRPSGGWMTPVERDGVAPEVREV